MVVVRRPFEMVLVVSAQIQWALVADHPDFAGLADQLVVVVERTVLVAPEESPDPAVLDLEGTIPVVARMEAFHNLEQRQGCLEIHAGLLEAQSANAVVVGEDNRKEGKGGAEDRAIAGWVVDQAAVVDLVGEDGQPVGFH